MLRTYPLHHTQQRPESLRQIFRRLEREIAAQPPRQRQLPETARRGSTFPF